MKNARGDLRGWSRSCSRRGAPPRRPTRRGWRGDGEVRATRRSLRTTSIGGGRSQRSSPRVASRDRREVAAVLEARAERGGRRADGGRRPLHARIVRAGQEASSTWRNALEVRRAARASSCLVARRAGGRDRAEHTVRHERGEMEQLGTPGLPPDRGTGLGSRLPARLSSNMRYVTSPARPVRARWPTSRARWSHGNHHHSRRRAAVRSRSRRRRHRGHEG